MPKSLIDKLLSEISEKPESEQLAFFNRQMFDFEQMIDIAKSFCSTLNFTNLLESIKYICMAQFHVLGAEIFIRDLISSDSFIQETENNQEDKTNALKIPAHSPLIKILLDQEGPVTMDYLEKNLDDPETLKTLKDLSPTLVIPLIQKNHLIGILLLLERIAIDNETAYTEIELYQIMNIASLASVAINNASLVEKSSTDMMTHLKLKYFFYNALTEAIDSALNKGNNISIIMFDIDFFKKFNDTYGHECGDYVLVTVADIIRSSLRGDDMAARYGGEEFTVMLCNADKEDAMLVAERIRSRIEKYEFNYNGNILHVTISGGISVFDIKTNPISSPKNLVNQADMGLYMSKRNGRNQITYFDPADTSYNGTENDD